MTDFTTPCTTVCSLDPFSSEVEPQDPPTANSISILKDEIQEYLERLRLAICADLQCIDAKLVELDQRVTTLEP
jgi:hypothetical protein